MNADAIVKALKCCNVPSGRACSECPYHEVGAKCRTQRNKDAVELILTLVEEKERCLDALSELSDNIGLLKEKARAEAVQKMQERLKYGKKVLVQSIDNYITTDKIEYAVLETDIDQIAKEMLEEDA